jgi:hypothetical protein
MLATNCDISRLRSLIVRCSHNPSRFLMALRMVCRSGAPAWIFASCCCKSLRRRRSRVYCSESDASESRRLTSRASSPVGIEMASIARSRFTKLSFSRDNSFRSVSPLWLMVRLTRRLVSLSRSSSIVSVCSCATTKRSTSSAGNDGLGHVLWPRFDIACCHACCHRWSNASSWNHGLSNAANQRARRVTCRECGRPSDTVDNELILHRRKHLRINDGSMLTFIHLFAVADFAEVDRIRQQSMQCGFIELTTAQLLAGLGNPALRSPTSGLDGFESSNESLALQVEIEDLTDSLCFQIVDDQLLGCSIDVVTQERPATDVLALASGGQHLVASSFADDLAFKLCERKQDVQRQTRCLLSDAAEVRRRIFADYDVRGLPHLARSVSLAIAKQHVRAIANGTTIHSTQRVGLYTIAIRTGDQELALGPVGIVSLPRPMQVRESHRQPAD